MSLAEAADPRVQAEKEAAWSAEHLAIGQVVLQVIPRMRNSFFHVFFTSFRPKSKHERLKQPGERRTLGKSSTDHSISFDIIRCHLIIAACGREKRNVQLLSAPWKRFTVPRAISGWKKQKLLGGFCGSLCILFWGVFIAANLVKID